MTDSEKRIGEICDRVRRTICPTWSDGQETIEGRILNEDFEYLIASLTAWRIIAKQNGQLASLTPSQQAKVLEDALDATTADWLKALDEIDRLKGKTGTAH